MVGALWGWGGRAGLSIARGMIPAVSKKFEAKNRSRQQQSCLQHRNFARHVARGEADQDPG